jgi:hypothetical protein
MIPNLLDKMMIIVETVYSEECDGVKTLVLGGSESKTDSDAADKVKGKGRAKGSGGEPLAPSPLYGLLNIECSTDVPADLRYHNLSTVNLLLDGKNLSCIHGLVSVFLSI